MTTRTLTGHDAIDFADATGAMLNKYTDPTEEARDGLSVDEAREIAHEDPSLIWLDVVVPTVHKFGIVPSSSFQRARWRHGSPESPARATVDDLDTAVTWYGDDISGAVLAAHDAAEARPEELGGYVVVELGTHPAIIGEDLAFRCRVRAGDDMDMRVGQAVRRALPNRSGSWLPDQWSVAARVFAPIVSQGVRMAIETSLAAAWPSEPHPAQVIRL